MADRDPAEDGGAGVDDDVVLHHRVAWQTFLQAAAAVAALVIFLGICCWEFAGADVRIEAGAGDY